MPSETLRDTGDALAAALVDALAYVTDKGTRTRAFDALALWPHPSLAHLGAEVRPGVAERDTAVVARATPQPDRLWKTCTFDEGKVTAEGEGKVVLHQRFTVSANGVLVEMIFTECSTPRDWKAQDVDSFTRERSTGRARGSHDS